MVAKLTKGFWPAVARIILRNRILILCAVAAATVFLVMQWKNIQFSNTEANILPEDHPATIQYRAFTNIFGEEGNAIVLAVRDIALFETDNFNRWNKLSKQLEAFPEVDFVVSTDNLKILEKDTTLQQFVVQPFLKGTPTNSNEIDSLKNNLIQSIPFYEGLIYNKDSETIQTIAYLDKDIMSTPVRNEFILNDLGDLVKNFEQYL